jgi:hypothetical protein
LLELVRTGPSLLELPRQPCKVNSVNSERERERERECPSKPAGGNDPAFHGEDDEDTTMYIVSSAERTPNDSGREAGRFRDIGEHTVSIRIS